MVVAKITPGDTPEITFYSGTDKKKREQFSSYWEARKWQYTQIFGESPDLSFLSSDDEAYLSDLFALNDKKSPKLIEGDPCRVRNLTRIAEALGLKKNIEEFLVKPQY